MLTTEQTTETMANTEHTPEKQPSRWFLAEYYLKKGIAWLLIVHGYVVFIQDFRQEGWPIMFLAGVYLLVNTKKK